jgi:hypothetical protein
MQQRASENGERLIIMRLLLSLGSECSRRDSPHQKGGLTAEINLEIQDNERRLVMGAEIE